MKPGCLGPDAERISLAQFGHVCCAYDGGRQCPSVVELNAVDQIGTEGGILDRGTLPLLPGRLSSELLHGITMVMVVSPEHPLIAAAGTIPRAELARWIAENAGSVGKPKIGMKCWRMPAKCLSHDRYRGKNCAVQRFLKLIAKWYKTARSFSDAFHVGRRYSRNKAPRAEISPLTAVLHRNPRIDVVRGAAILMVMILHFSDTYRLWHVGPLHALFGGAAVFAVIGWSNFGVTMFFVISGYLITTNALERYGALCRISLPSFYVKRFARLEPLLLIALAIIVTVGLIGVPPFRQPDKPTADILLGAWSVLTFWHNILMQRLGYFNYCLNIYWSLSVEDLFYLMFPLACIILRKTWLIAVLCLILIAIGPWYRAQHMQDDIFYLYANFACFDAIAMGVLCALVSRRTALSERTALILRIAASFALIALWLTGFGGSRKIYAFTLLALATAAIILGSQTGPAPAWAETVPARVIRWLGRHSYELYLFHIIILAVMRDIIPDSSMGFWPQLPWLALFLILSAATAGVAARVIGNPANRALRRRLDQPQAHPPSSVSI